MNRQSARLVWMVCLAALLTHLLRSVQACGRSPPSVAPAEAIFSPSDGASAAESAFLDTLARDTWTYLHSPQTTVHHLPYSWWSPTIPGGDYANPAEIGLYALSWLAAYDLGRPWSPSWSQTEAEIGAILDQLRAWQTGSQAYQPHSPNAYQNSVFYSNENRIINLIARALGQLDAEEFRLSLEALTGPAGSYGGITVAQMAWDGSYFTYAAPALFIREMDTAYGDATLLPATQAQIAYAHDQGYAVWGLSDCYDVGSGGYVQQGAPPAASPDPPETRPGLVTPHAAGLALITPLAAEAITNLQTISSTFACAYAPGYGFRDALMARPADPDYGRCSDRYSALAQEWLFLGLVNRESGFIWRYFYRHPGVLRAHVEMYGGMQMYLPLILRRTAP